MKKFSLFFQLLVIGFSLTLVGYSQTNKREVTREPDNLAESIAETDDCWKKITEPVANVTVSFCREPQKSIQVDSFKGLKIKRNNQLVSTARAVYVLGWFVWKLKSEDEISIRKLFDDYTKQTLKKESAGILKATKDLSVNGKIGRELTLIGNINEFSVQLFYSNGKLIYLLFIPNSNSKEVLDSLKKKYFESFQLLESK